MSAAEQPTVAELAADLRSEQEALDVVLADLAPEVWATPTASPGWTVADQVGHLTYFDRTAALAIVDPDAFQADLRELIAAGRGADDRTTLRGTPPHALLEAWRGGRQRLAEAAAQLDEAARIPWYGPPMGARSFLTARLMECWAHGQDVVDALGADRPTSDRLRHIAQLGVITRGWSYKNRRLEAPAEEVRVELAAPSGATWAFGPEGAEQRVSGPAEDFCLVVTQRRHVDDTALEVVGAAARDWMERAQAFAGPPTDGPAPRHR